MGRIPDGTIQEIRRRVDIVGLIGRYVELKRAGRNFVGRCPFHSEKTPSFNVSPERHAFHCFGCQEGGDAIAFVMKHDGLSFVEALHSLASECGVEITETSGGGSSDRGLAERLHRANGVAQRFYVSSLASPEGEAARSYLAHRGLVAADIAKYGVGYAPDRWDAVATALEREGIPLEAGETAGLLAPRKEGRGFYDRLRGRIVFPIHDVRDRIIGFGGRALADGQEPKYLNSPETPVYRKRETFYGFPDALSPIRSAGRAIICEGYFDRIALAQAGLGEAIASCGTALTREHGVQLKRRTGEVVLLFDGDAAGHKAMERSLEVLLPEGLRVKTVALPAGEDPDSFLRAHGAEALRKHVDAARDAIDAVIQRAVDVGCATPTQKADVVNRIVPLVALVPDPIERNEYARRVANWAATDERSVKAAVALAARGRVAPPIEPARPTAARDSSRERHLHELAVLLFRDPTLGRRFVREPLEALLPGGSYRAVIHALLDRGESEDCPSGVADLFAFESSLDENARARLREVALDSELFQSETEPVEVIEALVARLEKRKIDALQKELTRRMSDPGADIPALNLEKTNLKERGLGLFKRSNGASPGARGSEGRDGGSGVLVAPQPSP